jgi:type 1 glutamine amidotransferase
LLAGHHGADYDAVRLGTSVVAVPFRIRPVPAEVCIVSQSRSLAGVFAATAAVSLVLVVVPAREARAQRKAPDGAKILLLSGGQRQHHGYRDQAFYLASALEDTGHYEVTIDEDGAILESPAMAKYDILLVNADRRDPEFKFTKPQQEALLGWVKAGQGYVSVHAADNGAPDWLPGWREMLGGVFSHVGLPDSKVKKGTYAIKIVDTHHPITRGLSDFTLFDELYYDLQMEPGVVPLATTELEGKTWPIAWTRTYGKGRVFHCVLGHRDFGPGKDDPARDPNVLKLLVQGIDWVSPKGRK